jgi:hypothetical protein
LILFEGDDYVSRTDRILDTVMRCKRHRFTHVGLVITRQVFDDVRLHPDRFYILESTRRGPLADSVRNIDNQLMRGIQIRDLRAVQQACAGTLYHARMVSSWRQAYVPQHCSRVIDDVLGVSYQPLAVMLLCYFSTHRMKWLNDTELVVHVLRASNTIPSYIDPKRVCIEDFLRGDSQTCCPCIVTHHMPAPRIYEEPIEIHVS